MQKSTRSVAIGMISLMLAALMLAPLGSAQLVTFPNTSKDVDGIRPGLAGEELTVNFLYDFESPLLSAGTLEKQSAVIGVTTDCDHSQVFVTGPSIVTVPFNTPGTQTNQVAEKFSVSATVTAPGLTPVPCEIVATPRAHNTVPVNAGGESSTHQFNAVVDYYGAMSVNLASTIVGAAPYKDVPFNLEFTNFGNANTRITFHLEGENDVPDGERWQHVLPTDLIVGATPAGGDNTGTATFQVSTPYKTGWNNVAGTYLITMRTVALEDPESTGNTMTASLLIRVRGVYVPGFEAVAVAGSLLGAVMIVRRRGQE